MDTNVSHNLRKIVIFPQNMVKSGLKVDIFSKTNLYKSEWKIYIEIANVKIEDNDKTLFQLRKVICCEL